MDDFFGGDDKADEDKKDDDGSLPDDTWIWTEPKEEDKNDDDGLLPDDTWIWTEPEEEDKKDDEANKPHPTDAPRYCRATKHHRGYKFTYEHSDEQRSLIVSHDSFNMPYVNFTVKHENLDIVRDIWVVDKNNQTTWSLLTDEAKQDIIDNGTGSDDDKEDQDKPDDQDTDDKDDDDTTDPGFIEPIKPIIEKEPWEVIVNYESSEADNF